jgi:transcriptional regulator with XRE-family HTH domain
MLLDKRLAELRHRKGVSKREIALTLNLEQSTYGKYELGQRQPSLGILQKLADYFFVSTDYLLGKSDNPTPQDIKKEPATYDEFTEQEKELLNLFQELSEDDRDLLIEQGELLKRRRKQ